MPINAEQYEQKQRQINNLIDTLTNRPGTPEERFERRNAIRVFVQTASPIQAEGFSHLLGNIERKALRLNGAQADNYITQFNAVVGDLKLLQLAYFVEVKGYEVRGIEIPIDVSGVPPGDVDLIAVKGNTLLILFEAKWGTNVRSVELIDKTALKYNAFVDSNQVEPYVHGLSPGFNKLIVLYIPNALYRVTDARRQELEDSLMLKFDAWQFLRSIESPESDTIGL